MYSVITNKRLQLLIIILAAAAFFLDGLSTAIVNNILPVITETFSISIVESSLITQAYFLTFVAFILPFGKIADNGRIREVLIIGLCLFAFGLIICTIAPAFPALVAARFIQGLGAAMIAGACPVIVARLLPASKHGVGIGFAAAMAGISIAVGPIVGGFIASLASWQLAFLVSVPFAIAGAVLAFRILPKPGGERSKKKFDVFGTIFVFLIVASFVLIQNNFPRLGITDPFVLICTAVFAVSLILYIVHSLRCENPLLDVRIFTKKGFAAVSFSYMFLCAIYAGVLYIIPYYMQTGLNLDAGMSGLMLTIPAVIAAVIATPVGWWADKSGNRLPCILASSCYCIFCALFAFIKPEWGIPALVSGMVFVGLSFGLMGGPATARIIQCAPEDEKAEGASVMMFFNYLGCIVGVTAYTAAFALVEPASIGTALIDLPLDGFMAGFGATAVTGLIFGLLSLIMTLAVSSKVAK
ncbi:MAG TPA: MFS transporter [Methanocorpusculum sp.]|nr:MFS transporter [Methanocorpusculum sp.]